MDKVVHFEIPVDDVKRAKKFYGELFGWQMLDIPGMHYTILHTADTDENNMIKEPGAINGGVYKREGKSSKSPVIVIDVESIAEHISKVEAAGGKVVLPKREVGDMGLYAQVRDTEGNIIGLRQYLKSE